MTFQHLLALPAEKRCVDCKLYPRDVGCLCSACARFRRRTGQRREPWVAHNPIQLTMNLEQGG